MTRIESEAPRLKVGASRKSRLSGQDASFLSHGGLKRKPPKNELSDRASEGVLPGCLDRASPRGREEGSITRGLDVYPKVMSYILVICMQNVCTISAVPAHFVNLLYIINS